MNDDIPTPEENNEELPKKSRPQSQEVRHTHVSALVPEHVAKGAFSTGAVVVQGTHEFIVDFLLRMTNPQQLVARVILPPGVVGQLISALGDNLRNYERKFGPTLLNPPTLHEKAATSNPESATETQQLDTTQTPPTPQPTATSVSQTSAQDLYDQLKMPDDVLSGNYANAVMIGHTMTEFCFDFITTFYPKSAVAARVYLAAANAKRFLEALTHSFEQYKKKVAERAGNQPPPSPREGEDSHEN